MTKFLPLKQSTVQRKYDVMIQYGGFDSINDQEARSANIILVKSKTVLLIDVLENKVISCDMIVYAPNFEKVDGAYCFWSVRGCVGGCVGHTFCTYCNF